MSNVAGKALLIGLSMFLSATSDAAARPDDYARGLRLDNPSGRPLAEIVVPDEVYRTVTRADLGDVRVFNADGIAVAHALCAAPTSNEPLVSRVSLPVFDLQAPATDGSSGTRVEVTTTGGVQLRVQEGETAATSDATRTWAHVIDARAVTDALRSIEFDWRSPDGASQADVRVEASNDLNTWRTLVAASTLLRVSRNGQQLQRDTVPLTSQRYDFLRVVRTDGGPPLQITAVIGERVTQAAEIEPVWFRAAAVGATVAGESLFDAERLAPITYARIVLPQPNSSVRVRLQSRADAQAEWRERWSGEVYSILTQGQTRASPPARIDVDHDRYWRLLYPDASAALAPALELGYRPATLRFLAQGASPFTLAFGSRRAEATPALQCDDLLSDVSLRDKVDLVGEATPGEPRTLGGDTAFKPLPKKTPVRQVVLWSVLILGVAVLLAMAFSLFKRLNTRT